MIAFLLLAAATPPVLRVAPAALADERLAAPASRLVWPDGTTVTIEERGGELVARFDRPLAPAAIDAFRDAAQPGIGDLRWNDDSLVLRAADGWRMTSRLTGATLVVTFAPPVAAPATTADPDADAARDVAFAAIEADVAAGYTGRARRAAAALATRDPKDRRAARLLADIRSADGDLAGAARDYRTLGADDRAARRAIAAGAGTAAIGVVARDGDDLSQAEFGARVDAAIGDRWAMGAGLRRIESRVAAPGGAVNRGGTVVDASVTAALADAVRVQLLASTQLDDTVTGGGVRATAGSADAQFRTTLLRHMPDFSTPAQVLAGGYLSRASVGGTLRLSPGLVAQADIGANRYGLAGRRGASDTVTAAGGVDYLIRRQFPALGLSYRFEAEYVQRMRNGPDGFPLIPLATRENHTLQGLVSGALGDVQLTGLAGWTVDRFGGDGPTASVGLAAPIGDAWRIEAGAGVTSVSRPGFSGRQLFGRAQLTRSLGSSR